MDTILKVVEAATDFDLIDVDTIKSELNFTDEDDARDTWLGDKITRLSIAAATACKRIFAVQTYSETIRLTGSLLSLKLAHYPLVSITSVKLGGVVQDPATYDFDAATAIVYRKSGSNITCWPCGSVEVTYRAGYADIPGDLQEAIIIAMKGAWYARTRDPLVVGTGGGLAGETRYWAGAAPGQVGVFPKEAQDILEGYRKVSVR